ncbi:MAG: hypothetical protein RMY29_013090 [Nostoc sp. CreGUA01]|nr:hypothetical protein [Nostoc sp. CreGUA01]
MGKSNAPFPIHKLKYGGSYSDVVQQSGSEHWQTVAFLYDDNMRIPKFLLKPKNILEQLTDFLGSHDIKFENNPRFSEQYLLRGSHEQDIRQIFTDNILTFFEGKIGFYPAIQTTPFVEAADACLIYYLQDVRFEPEQMELFLKEAMEVFELFRAKTSDN